MVDFKDYLKKKLKEKGLSLREFSREVDIDVGFVSKILKGLRSPPQDERIIKRIAEVIGEDEDYLIFLAGRIPKKYIRFFSSFENFKKIKDIIYQKNSDSEKKTLSKKKLVREIPDEIL